jgi:anti-sigma regulatory factor (Ser/Thr protein kinase)
MAGPVTKTFIFHRSNQSLVASLKQILDFVSEHTHHHTDTSVIQFKAKVITTELLNNAIKHSGDTETIIDVVIDNQKITIKKTDNGPQYDPGGLLTLSVRGETITLSSDDLNSMYAIVQDDYTIKFIFEENIDKQMVDLNSISEHFGLLIIARSADEFTYHYDNRTYSNVFLVEFGLHK